MTKTNNIMTQSTKKTNQESTIEENDVYVRMPLAKINFILICTITC